MNNTTLKTQKRYRKEREQINFSIIDLNELYKKIAEEGLLWTLKDMKDLCEAETILINHYLNKYRSLQTYDNLETSSTTSPHSKTSSTQFSLKNSNESHLTVNSVKTFTAYVKAKELEMEVFKLTKNFPFYEKYHIVDQLERSSSSIKMNISKGEQKHIREKFNKYSVAIGSAKETATWLQVSANQSYITEDECSRLDRLLTEIVSILIKTLVNIKNKDGKGMNLPEPYALDVKKYRAYQLSLTLVDRIYELSNKSSFWSKRDLQHNLRINATSVVANIAEAQQLYIRKKFAFFNESLTSLKGLESYLETATISRVVNENDLVEINKLIQSIRKILVKTLSNHSSCKHS